MKQLARIAFLSAALFTACSASARASQISGGSVLSNENGVAAGGSRYAAVLTETPDTAMTIRMLVSSSLFGSCYLLSRKRK